MKPCAYATDWSFGYDRIHKPMSEQQAREIHLTRKPFSGYAAIFGSPAAPTHCVKVSFNERDLFYLCMWIDALRRKHTEFQFKRLEPGRLFLTIASEFWYDGDSDRMATTIQYLFNPTGTVRIIKSDRSSGIHEHRDSKCDVTGNWEPLPEFGRYDGLLTAERNLRYPRQQ
jgi:hypothetical protein